jgi:hypothetical protein
MSIVRDGVLTVLPSNWIHAELLVLELLVRLTFVVLELWLTADRDVLEDRELPDVVESFVLELVETDWLLQDEVDRFMLLKLWLVSLELLLINSDERELGLENELELDELIG